MKIAIDISQIVYGTGVSLYTKSLVENLLKIDHDNEYLLFAGALRRRSDVLKMFPGAQILPIPPMVADFVWNRVHQLPIDKLIGKIDVLHTSDWAEPASSAFKVTTIHDLYPLKFPKLIDPRVRDVHTRRLSWVFRESSRIIVPSLSTKNDLLELGVDEPRIRVVGEAPVFSRAPEEAINKAKLKYGIKGNYLIAIGVTALKNTLRIVKAFHLASAGRDLKLVLAGRPTGVKITEERNVRVLGYVPNEDLEALLTGSSGLIFASVYEGYGIPILDAFACGVPVVTSNTASMPEVTGEAAVLVDPMSVHSIGEGIARILRGPKGYVEKGLSRVKDFSWEKTARETLAVYKEALE